MYPLLILFFQQQHNQTAAVVIEGQGIEPPRQHPALNNVEGLVELNVDILDDDIDEGLGEEGDIQEERASSVKVDVLDAP